MTTYFSFIQHCAPLYHWRQFNVFLVLLLLLLFPLLLFLAEERWEKRDDDDWSDCLLMNRSQKEFTLCFTLKWINTNEFNNPLFQHNPLYYSSAYCHTTHWHRIQHWTETVVTTVSLCSLTHQLLVILQYCAVTVVSLEVLILLLLL